MSIAAQCPDCCTCPTATVEWDSVSASKSKCGWPEFGTPSVPPKYYITKTISGSLTVGPIGTDASAGWEYSENGCSGVRTGYTSVNGENCGSVIEPFAPSGGSQPMPGGSSRTCSNPDFGGDSSNVVSVNTSKTLRTWTAVPSDTGTVTEALSDEYTTLLLKSNTVTALPAYDDDWNDTAGSFANLSADELSYAIRESRYRLRFMIPQVNTGKNYRASWVERFIPEAGVGIDSVEVYSPGVYRPTVTISAPPAGGTQASAVAVMSSAGAVSSIRILNPGAGYTSAPTITVQSATGGGTTSTGWTATLTGGQVTAITGGSAGNYLPTLAFSGGGGSGATATTTMDDQGGISAVTVGASGSGYTSAPTLTITAKVSGALAADLLLHLGTETPRCDVWDGVTPPGYDPATPSTYPILGDGTNPYFELTVPSTDGTTLVANVRAVCDGSPCP